MPPVVPGREPADPALSERFAAEVSRAEETVRLDLAALLIAAHGSPSLDVEVQLARLDRLAEEVPVPTLDGLRALLFRDLGFSGDVVNYGDPRNSYLDHVLDRRTGIPISLSVLMIEVGRRAGVPLAGVSMPGHFLVRDKVDPSVFVDAFARGAVIDRDACRRRFAQIHGPDAPFDDAFLAPVGPLAIVARMLANLEAIADRAADVHLLSWVLRLRCMVPGAGLHEHLRMAAALRASGHFDIAADALDRFAAASADLGAAATAGAEARRLRSRLN